MAVAGAMPGFRQGEFAMRGLGIAVAGLVVGLSGTVLTAQKLQTEIAEGKGVYETYCTTCHGPVGKGDGQFASSIRKRPPDLTLLSKQNKGKFPEERVLQFIDGRVRGDAAKHSDMPVWSDVFAKSSDAPNAEGIKARLVSLVKYLETLQEK
jgi:mono/diheme cytochrome c family protein